MCLFCSINVVEDEYHFLLVCPLYNEIRRAMLPKYYCRCPSINKFCKILNENKTSILKKLAKFILAATEKKNFHSKFFCLITMFVCIYCTCSPCLYVLTYFIVFVVIFILFSCCHYTWYFRGRTTALLMCLNKPFCSYSSFK